MRPLEIALVTANLLAFFGLAVPLPAAASWLRHAPALALLLAGAQLFVDGQRWHMFPAYTMAALLAAIWLPRTFAPRSTQRREQRLSRLAVGLGLVGIPISIFVPLMFPVFRLPYPTGAYGIGTLTYHWIDTDRREIFTADPNARRELMVQIWYPARSEPSSPRVPYVKNARVLAPLASLLRLPAFTLDHLRYITTNAIEAAPVAEGEVSYPVLIFSHGRGGYRQHNTWEVEELVSRGYVVAAIDHTYVAAGVVFPDGHLAPFDERMRDRAFEDDVVPYLAQDAIFVLGQLRALNHSENKGILTGRLDLQRAGIFGLSLGGEVSAEACRREPQLRACLAMDVWMPSDVARGGLQQPGMWISRDAATMRQEGWSKADVDKTLGTLRAAFERTQNGYLVLVPGMFHQDFSDAPLLSPLSSLLGITGPIEARRAHDIVCAYSLAFFDRHLRDRPAELLDGTAKPYPEALFEAHRP